MGKKKTLPDRWEKYRPIGRPVAGTKFLPFKTPLTRFPQGHKKKFTIQRLVESQPHLRAVINLTNTNRYYEPSEFIKRGVLYKQISTRGHVVPSKEIVLRFFDAVDGFLDRLRNDKNALIGVHCTHGLNRTGYLICKYMVARMKINPQQAIKDFQQARGHKIERRNYINDILGVIRDDQQTEQITDTLNSTEIVQQFNNVNNDDLHTETPINWREEPKMDIGDNRQQRPSFGHYWYRKSEDNQQSTINWRSENTNNQQSPIKWRRDCAANQQDRRNWRDERKNNVQNRKNCHSKGGNYSQNRTDWRSRDGNYPQNRHWTFINDEITENRNYYKNNWNESRWQDSRNSSRFKTSK